MHISLYFKQIYIQEKSSYSKKETFSKFFYITFINPTLALKVLIKEFIFFYKLF